MQQVELICSIDRILKMIPLRLRKRIQYFLDNKVAEALQTMRSKIVTGSKDHKKMNCQLYGTEIMESNTKTPQDLEEGEHFTDQEVMKKFSLPDLIMIGIYERNKEYVITYCQTPV